MLFAAALPDLAPQGLQRAALGCLLATLAVIKTFSDCIPLDQYLVLLFHVCLNLTLLYQACTL